MHTHLTTLVAASFLLVLAPATHAQGVARIPLGEPAELGMPRDGSGVSMVAPGTTMEFTSLAGPIVGPDCEMFSPAVAPPIGAPDSVCVTNRGAPASSPLQSFALVIKSLNRAKSVVVREHPFQISPGIPGLPDGALLRGRVAGVIDYQGFLAAVGVAQAKVTIAMKVVDETQNDLIVCTHDIYKNALRTTLAPEVKGSVGGGAEGGVPYGGLSLHLEPGIGFKIEAKQEVIRVKGATFDFPVVLQRGHVYRLELELESFVKTGIVPGLATSFFYGFRFDGSSNSWVPTGGAAEPPSVIDCGWNALKELLVPPVPSVVMQSVEQSTSWWPSEFKSFFENLFGTSPNRGLPYYFSRITELAGAGTELRKFIDVVTNLDIFSIRDYFCPFPLLAEEFLGNPGVQLTRLCVTLDQDQAEQDVRFRIQQDLLQASGHVASFQLPARFGGQLEVAREIVDAAITMMKSAGQSVRNAPRELASGDVYLGRRDYRTAYAFYSQAYRSVTK